jgi:hypothetical protein
MDSLQAPRQTAQKSANLFADAHWRGSAVRKTATPDFRSGLPPKACMEGMLDTQAMHT